MSPCTQEEKISEIHQDVKEIKDFIFKDQIKTSNKITRIETFLIAAWSVILLGATFLVKG